MKSNAGASLADPKVRATPHHRGGDSSPLPAAAIGFRPEFLDFRRGIHVGNLEENERITRILKLALEARYRQGFVTERWGRGVFWQWIAFLPRADREAKPLSSHVSFGCSKFFISVETKEKLFKCGLQVERGYVKAPRSSRDCELRPDWDWHRLVKGLRPGSPVDSELRRLILREGFSLFAGSWESEHSSFPWRISPGPPSSAACWMPLPGITGRDFQVFYPMTEEEVLALDGCGPGGVHARRLRRSHPADEFDHAD